MGTPRLSRKMETVLAALLTERTYADAAAKAGVSETTIYRWLRERPQFAAAHRDARRDIAQHTLTRLQRLTGLAADRLEAALTCGTPAVEVKAADTVYKFVFKGLDTLDLMAEVQELESLRDQHDTAAAAGPPEGDVGTGPDGEPDLGPPQAGPLGSAPGSGVQAGPLAGDDTPRVNDWLECIEDSCRPDPPV
jgi:hypothetical protein